LLEWCECSACGVRHHPFVKVLEIFVVKLAEVFINIMPMHSASLSRRKDEFLECLRVHYVLDRTLVKSLYNTQHRRSVLGLL
jgi:hypothetical protein